MKHEFDEKHQLNVVNMLKTFNSLQRPQLDDNPANDLLISDVKCSLDNYVDSVKAEGFMEFSLGIPIHRVSAAQYRSGECLHGG